MIRMARRARFTDMAYQMRLPRRYTCSLPRRLANIRPLSQIRLPCDVCAVVALICFTDAGGATYAAGAFAASVHRCWQCTVLVRLGGMSVFAKCAKSRVVENMPYP